LRQRGRREKKPCNGWAEMGRWARNKIWNKWAAETVFQIWEQGFEIKIKGFKYFQTKFELKLD
jgi:hypothetical protein